MKKHKIFGRKQPKDEKKPLLINIEDNVETLRTGTQTTAFVGALQHYGSFGPPSVAPVDLSQDVDESIFMRDSKGMIDFVLAYQPHVMTMEEEPRKGYKGKIDKFKRRNTADTNALQTYREKFEQKLKEEGLVLEHEGIESEGVRHLEQSQDGKTCFLKVHAPWDVLARAAEIMRVKMPIKKSDISEEEDTNVGRESQIWFKRIFGDRRNPLMLEDRFEPPPVPTYFTLEFDRSRLSQFVCKDRNTFFSQTARLRLVWDILQRTSVSASEVGPVRLKGHHEGESIGFNYLLKHSVYVGAFPLHDSNEHLDPNDKSRKPAGLWPMRTWLYETWARPGRWSNYQPLDQIRAYFGEKVGVYFAWLGFYTTMLIPLAILGVASFIYGLSTCSEDVPMIDACYSSYKDTIICRSCDETTCEFERLDDYCLYAVVNAVFDNYSTFPFALATSIWAILFLELWKRYQARLSCKWDTVDVEHEYEPPRPEYQADAKERRRHPVTREWEPYISEKAKTVKLMKSFSGVTFFMCVVLAVITSIILYKILMVNILNNLHNSFIDTVGSSTFTSLTASVLSSICMITLEKIYGQVAWKLTERELPRTMSDFEQSFTYKMYIFQFVNYYATLIYLAFIQGNMAETPITNTIYTDYCSPIGCMFSVTMQLCVVLIVKQMLQNCLEILIPYTKTYWKRRHNVADSEDNIYTRYEKDFDLQPLNELPLLGEYLEMVLQYGFVTMFGAAFPPAALLALINNIAEIRIDAHKFVVSSRRAIPHRAADIGNWYGILEFVTRLAILTNAVLIAFTTDVIDRIVYLIAYSEDGTLDKYLDFTLSLFDTKDWEDPELMYQDELGNVSTCRYKGYYTAPEDEYKYAFSKPWWIITLLKVGFIPLFQNLVLFIQGFIQYLIPDVPEDVNLHIQRNRYVSMEAAHERERERRRKATEPHIPTQETKPERKFETNLDDIIKKFETSTHHPGDEASFEAPKKSPRTSPRPHSPSESAPVLHQDSTSSGNSGRGSTPLFSFLKPHHHEKKEKDSSRSPRFFRRKPAHPERAEETGHPGHHGAPPSDARRRKEEKRKSTASQSSEDHKESSIGSLGSDRETRKKWDKLIADKLMDVWANTSDDSHDTV